MNPIVCEVLLVVLAFAVGALLPRKKQEHIVKVKTQIEPPKYGLFLPPGCDEVSIKYLDYCSNYMSLGNGLDYTNLTFKPKKKTEIKFRNTDAPYNYQSSEVEGEIK